MVSSVKGKLIDFALSREGKQRITIETDSDFSDEYDSLKDSDISVEIKKYRKPRSIDANNYAWVLIDKIAARIGLTKIEVYRNAIRSIGGVSEIVCIKENAVYTLKTIWESRGIGWQVEIEPSKLAGCVNAVLHYGSSVYDTKQMSDLINSLVSDAQAIGIETEPPEYIESLLSHWAGRKEVE